ncbi:importin subunit alpha-1-like isoform X2 [Dysidea avara]|uniref:importin subunit alpha-1-like isoform X2 n=1 Tax=Dysidea avara TaxID=196820 RepID=UPI00332E0528
MLCEGTGSTANCGSLQRENSRLRSFKNNRLEPSELKRRRTDVSVELRKAKREAELLKRRNITADADKNLLLREICQSNISDIFERIKSADTTIQLAGVQNIRKLLSMDNHSLIEAIVESGIVPNLVQFLSRMNSVAIQFEAAWVLANITSGTSQQTYAVVDAGAIPHFIRLLSSHHNNIKEQALWAIANIAGDGSNLRDTLIKNGVIFPLITLISSNMYYPGPFLKNSIWTLSNFCRHKDPPPSYETVTQLLPTLTSLLHHNDKEVVSDACRILSYLTDSSIDRIELVVKCGIVPCLVSLLSSDDITLLEPALRTVGNIITGREQHVGLMLDNGVLENFGSLLRHQKANIQKEAAWAISNITAGPQKHIEVVIQYNLVPALVILLAEGTTEQAQREVVWAVANIAAGGTIQQVCHLLQAGVLRPLCDLLTIKDAKVTVIILDAINNILMAVDKVNHREQVCIMIEEVGGLDKIESLQQHANPLVYNAALAIIERYFNEFHICTE